MDPLDISKSRGSSLGILDSFMMKGASGDDIFLDGGNMTENKDNNSPTSRIEDEQEEIDEGPSFHVDNSALENLDADFSDFDTSDHEQNQQQQQIGASGSMFEMNGGSIVQPMNPFMLENIMESAEETVGAENSMMAPQFAPQDMHDLQQMKSMVDFDFSNNVPMDNEALINAAEKETQEQFRFMQEENMESNSNSGNTTDWSIHHLNPVQPSILFAAGSGPMGNLGDSDFEGPSLGMGADFGRKASRRSPEMKNKRKISPMDDISLDSIPTRASSAGRCISTPVPTRSDSSDIFKLPVFSCVSEVAEATNLFGSPQSPRVGIDSTINSPISASAIQRMISRGTNASKLVDLLSQTNVFLDGNNRSKLTKEKENRCSTIPERSEPNSRNNSMVPQKSVPSSPVSSKVSEQPTNTRSWRHKPIMNRALNLDGTKAMAFERTLQDSTASMTICDTNCGSDLECSRSSLTFGCVNNASSVSQSVTINNPTNKSVTVSCHAPTNSNAFKVYFCGICPPPQLFLHPGESKTMEVIFCPSTVNSYSDRIEFESITSDKLYRVPVTGFGGSAEVRVSPKNPSQLPYQTSPLTVTNRGSRDAFAIFAIRDPNAGLTISEKYKMIPAQSSVDVSLIAGPKFHGETVFIAWGEEIMRRRMRRHAVETGTSAKWKRFIFESDDLALQQCSTSPQIYKSEVRSFFGTVRKQTLRVEFGQNTNTSLSLPVAPLVKVEKSVTSRDVYESHGQVTVKCSNVLFSRTTVGAWDSVKAEFRNISRVTKTIEFNIKDGPFSLRKLQSRALEPMKFIRVPVYFEPVVPGIFYSELIVTVDKGIQVLHVNLKGEAVE